MNKATLESVGTTQKLMPSMFVQYSGSCRILLINFKATSRFIAASTVGGDLPSTPKVHPTEVIKFIKETLTCKEVAAEMAMGGVQIFHGNLHPNAVLYIPAGFIIAEASISNPGTPISRFQTSLLYNDCRGRQADTIEFILESVRSYQKPPENHPLVSLLADATRVLKMTP